MYLEAEQTVLLNLKDLVPEDHFFCKLKKLFPWEEWARPFEKCFKGEKEYGPKGYPVSVLLKMTVLSFLYNMGDKQTENYVKDNLATRYFIGLGLHQSIPDDTTICRFRARIVNMREENLLNKLFDEVLNHAQKKGVQMGKVQIIDSVHTNSKINPDKEKKDEPPKDPDASWGCKGTGRKKNPETGELEKYTKWFYGYKSHTTLNQKTNLFTSLLFSTGRNHDSLASRFLLEDDIKKGVKPSVITGDKAYDSLDFYSFCGKHNIFPAIRLMKYRLNQKSKKNCEKWLEHTRNPFYNKALGKRYKIEQGYRVGKLYHGLGECRYTGIRKFAFQGFLTFMSINLKRIMKMLKFITEKDLKLSLVFG